MEKEKFEQIVMDTLEELPDKFKERIKNLGVVIENRDIRPALDNNKNAGARLTLGLYQGLPATLRAGRRNLMPDKITIYKKALEKVSRNDVELEKNIKRVVLHELGHYFGLDEERLRKLGY